MGSNQRHKGFCGSLIRGFDTTNRIEPSGKGTTLKLDSEQQVVNGLVKQVKLSAFKEKARR